MDRIEVSTVVYLPPAEVYEFLIDFPRYATYSEYLREVRRHGDGDAGTEYDLHFKWWKLTYRLRTRVTDVDPPNRVDWKVVKDLRARGSWVVEEDADAAPEGRDTASRVTLRARFDPDSADAGTFDLPAFVSLDWVVDKVKPVIEEEAEKVVRRIVADLEGESRSVDLEVRT